MVHYKFLIVDEGLKALNESVRATIQKYKRHGTISRLSGSVRLTLQRIVHELCNSYRLMTSYIKETGVPVYRLPALQ